ncbi:MULTISPECIES: transcriptional regulator [unclassified Leeuwenhoekiella]|uniref:transcriptional regulator n=1 Tax=unclassified Leeuwenhoekiella TaxID=2615029 RepID=UPI000C656536|nr:MULTISPECIES: transcriptional regulator [unclassified Leeuwenhoekiella]MAW93821.1 transcriptional regulator [Leeuwenhoekiella sp.]MBA82228.1 transcriptional regulator [Leeuwenhoekiella sp.]|tara:strand:- start:2819 stop:3412 length:594 start_codon:yes stop_codon:yes gene_type:complete
MIAILTADIINSRTQQNWLPVLKEVLNHLGDEPKDWEIYRGDSFQLEVSPKKALYAALLLKSGIKSLEGVDVRIAIGLGNKTHNVGKITESNGSAFINSGTCFDRLKKQTLALQSDDSIFDAQFNLIFELACLTMDNWTPVSAQVFHQKLLHPQLNQTELSEMLGKSQSTISATLNRAGYDELTKMLQYYSQTLNNY